MSDYAGIQKRVRKGTKSCLPCRKRKIRCSGAGNDGEPCRECASRKDSCVAQGIVLDDNEALNKRLQERVALLEASLRELAQSATSDHSTKSIPSVLSRTCEGDEYVPTEDNESGRIPQIGEAIEATTAPLMCLLSNPVLGASTETLSSNVKDKTSSDYIATHLSAKHNEAVRDLCKHMPSEAEMSDIFDNSSSWWALYRDALGCVWGDNDLTTLRAFATRVLKERSPPMLGLLLVCFAISTGDLRSYLPPVEQHVVNDDEYAGSEAGLNCLMALGLCYMSSLQPRRAWMVHRRANCLIQLNGIHLRRKTDKHEVLFWQLFHADRWVSLMIGLPYMMPDQLCDLTIPPLGELDEGTWLYRQLAVLTGRVIDCLQAVTGATLSATLRIEEEMEKIRAQLSPGYLEMSSIRACKVSMEKYIRLYRVVHFYQLRSFIHLPFLLRSATQDRYEFSRKSCIDDSRRILEGYLEVHDSNPLMVTNGTVINFNVFISAGIVLLGLIGYGRSNKSEYVLSESQTREDWHTFHQVMEVLKQGAKDKSAGTLCQTCHTALENLLASARAGPGDAAKKVVLPYFGTLSITHHGDPAQNKGEQSRKPWKDAKSSTVDVDLPLDPMFGLGMEFAYDGPFLPDSNDANWMFADGAATQQAMHGGIGYDWYGGGGTVPSDWSWLGADLPPNIGL